MWCLRGEVVSEYRYEKRSFRFSEKEMDAIRGLLEMDLGYAPGELGKYEPPKDPKVAAAVEDFKRDIQRKLLGLE